MLYCCQAKALPGRLLGCPPLAQWWGFGGKAPMYRGAWGDFVPPHGIKNRPENEAVYTGFIQMGAIIAL